MDPVSPSAGYANALESGDHIVVLCANCVKNAASCRNAIEPVNGGVAKLPWSDQIRHRNRICASP